MAWQSPQPEHATSLLASTSRRWRAPALFFGMSVSWACVVQRFSTKVYVGLVQVVCVLVATPRQPLYLAP